MDEADAARFEEGRRSWKREIAMQRAAAAGAVAAASVNLQKNRRAAIDAVARYSGMHSSEERLQAVLPLISASPPALFWPIFLTEWSSCDNTWPHTRKVRLALKRQHATEPSTPYLSPEARKFRSTLSSVVTVYRGCSRDRVNGLAWTTDRAIAEGFAKGHRSIPVPNAVIAQAMIPKEEILFVCVDRDEKEVVLDPQNLQNVSLR